MYSSYNDVPQETQRIESIVHGTEFVCLSHLLFEEEGPFIILEGSGISIQVSS